MCEQIIEFIKKFQKNILLLLLLVVVYCLFTVNKHNECNLVKHLKEYAIKYKQYLIILLVLYFIYYHTNLIVDDDDINKKVYVK